MALRGLVLVLMAAAAAAAAAAGADETPVKPHPVLIRFPDVPPGGELVMTQGAERPLRVQYHESVEPKTFRATLNGRDITALFDAAAPSRIQTIRLPVTPGRNTLRIEVNSRAVAADPTSALLPQEHVLTIRLDPMAVGARASKRSFRSQAELDAWRKQEDERIERR